jgi:stage V sporulation protein B
MSTKPHIVNSLFWLTLAEILFNVSGYIIHAVAGRVLGPADYGRYSLVITLTTVVIILIGNGIPTAMSKYLSEAFEKEPGMVPVIKRQGIRLQMLLMGTVTLAFFLSAPVIAQVLQDPTLTPLFRFSSLIIPAFAASSFYFYYFTGLHLFQHQAALKMFRSVMRIVVTVSLVVLFHVYGAIAGYILAPLFTFMLGLYLDKKLSNSISSQTKRGLSLSVSSPEKKKEEFPWRKLLNYAWPLTLFMLFYEVFISIDLYLVKGLLQDDTLTGYYNAALTIGRIPYYLFYALSIVLLPALAKMSSEKNTQEMQKLMTQSLRYAGITLLPTFILLWAYAEPAVVFLFGAQYTAAAPALQVLTFGLSWLTVFYLVCSAFNGIGHAKLSMWLAVIGALANTILNYTLIPKFGLMGAAYATTVSAIITTLITLVISQRYIPVSIHLDGIFKTLLAGALLWILALALPTGHNLVFIVYSTLLSTLYLGVLYFLKVLTPEDLNRFTKAFAKKRESQS